METGGHVNRPADGPLGHGPLLCLFVFSLIRHTVTYERSHYIESVPLFIAAAIKSDCRTNPTAKKAEIAKPCVNHMDESK